MYLQTRVTLRAFPVATPRGRSVSFPIRGTMVTYVTWDVPHTYFTCANSPSWPTKNCLVWKWLLCEEFYIYWYTIENRQWIFFARNMLLMWPHIYRYNKHCKINLKWSINIYIMSAHQLCMFLVITNMCWDHAAYLWIFVGFVHASAWVVCIWSFFCLSEYWRICSLGNIIKLTWAFMLKSNVQKVRSPCLFSESWWL